MPERAAIEGVSRRHDLLRVAPGFWPSILTERPEVRDLSFVAEWAERGWPVIRRQTVACDPPDRIPVGLPLPPSADKRRISLTVPPADVISSGAPPRLETVRTAAPAAWAPTLDRLAALGDRRGAPPRVFGSLLWAYETGLPYLSSTSDLDLIWPASSDCDIAALLAEIDAIAQTASVRIDGEVVFSDGCAVKCIELHRAFQHGPDCEVLAKSIDGVRIIAVGRLVDMEQTA